jgi:general stress protein 26
MRDDVKQKVSNFLSSHAYINLATVSADGTPLAHTLGYASDGATVYFMTDKNTRKAKNITGNPSVAYTVDEDHTELGRIQGIQMTGKASLLTDNSIIEKVMGIMAGKFPGMSEMPQNPDYVFFKIEPAEAQFIDNTQGFGHRDVVNY